MSAGRFPVEPTLQRLRDNVPSLKLIEPCTDIKAAIDQKPRAFPAAFVVTSRAGSKPAGASGGMLIQSVALGVQIILFVKNFAGTPNGSGAAKEMDALIDDVDEALLNWSPSSDFQPLSLATGQDVPYGGTGVLIAHEAYRSKGGIRATRKT
jgi:hypothetical protein